MNRQKGGWAVGSRLMLVWLAWVPLASLGQQMVPAPGAPQPGGFEHLPLLYEGPDPTANEFLSAAAVPAVSERSFPPPTDAWSDGMVPGTDPPFPGPPFEPQWQWAPGEDEGGRLKETKDGFFQKVSFSAGWLDRGKASGFGITELELFGMVALPLPTREWPLVISPTFNVRLLDGPAAPALPGQLYEAYLDLLWLPRFGPRWTGILSVAPSYYGDGQVDDREAFRWTGRGLVRLDWVPQRWQLLAGVLYLNRENVRLLPAGGVIWNPSEDREYEMVFPRPKFAHRITRDAAFEDWLYLAAEFGGNSFAIQREGAADILTLKDYRIYFGVERKMGGGAGCRIEIGYVFSRSGEFASGMADIDAPATAFLRAGASF